MSDDKKNEEGLAMNGRMRVVAHALTVLLTVGLLGCAAGRDGSSAGGLDSREEIISGGFIPNEITNIQEGGEFDNSTLTPHDSEEIPLSKLEGFWAYEGIAYDGRLSDMTDGESPVVTDKTMTLNEMLVECLPKSLDIRPYSPMKSLISQGFGYGAAVFEDATERDPAVASIVALQTSANMPYSGNGFICVTDGKTLALGFLEVGAEMEEFGRIVNRDESELDECSLTEVDYEMSVNGDRLTLSYGGVSATYVRQVSGLLGMLHDSKWLFGEPLYEGSDPISLLTRSPKDLSETGYVFDFDLDAFLPSRGISDEFAIKTPGGTTMSAKLVNPYEKSVPAGYTKVCWYRYDSVESGNVTVGMPSSHEGLHLTQEFGVTPFADVYNTYEFPYELTEGSLFYKCGYIMHYIETFTPPEEGFDTGNLVLESGHSSEVRLEFEDNTLSAISVGDPVYLSAGMQANVSHDDLYDLQPSVYREVEERRDEILDGLKRAFEDAGLNAAINERTGEVALDNGVLFAKDSYELGDEGKEYLDGVFSAYASVVLDDRYAPSLKEVSFEGNTDSDGDSEYNMRLSELRAQAVMDYCSSILDDRQRAAFDGLAACRGYGESDLVYDESGHEDMDASRRVAIKFMLDVEDLKSGAGADSGDAGSGGEPSGPAGQSAASAGTPGSGDDSPESAGTAGQGDAPSTDSGQDGELGAFRGMSGGFDQAWTFYEKSGGDGSVHAAVLLLSAAHDRCAYLDVKQEGGSDEALCAYTFGEASAEEVAGGTEAITVKCDGGEDELSVVFGAWGRDDTVCVSDPWGGVCNLTAQGDVGSAVAFFEEVLAA